MYSIYETNIFSVTTWLSIKLWNNDEFNKNIYISLHYIEYTWVQIFLTILVMNARALSIMRYQDDINKSTTWSQYAARQWLNGQSAWLAMDKRESSRK